MGIRDDYPLSQKEFDGIYSRVPRLTVEVLVPSDNGVLLTLRTIEPCIGTWHLPGGTVRYGEWLIDAVKRIGKKELGISVKSAKQLGIIEYPDHVESGYGDPRGVAFLVEDYEGDITIDEEAEEHDWFDQAPDNMHPNQEDFLIEQGLFKPRS